MIRIVGSASVIHRSSKSAGWPMPLRSRRPDTRDVASMDPNAARDPVLTSGQIRAAPEHRARPKSAREPGGGVFFYRSFEGNDVNAVSPR